jgi:uncharacterized membrane protein YfcA
MLETYVILCLSAVAGGAINSVAGGGTLLTFPARFAALGSSPMAAVVANATSTVALFPGSLAALAGYRREIRECWHWVLLLMFPSLAGGLIGSLLVVVLPSRSFKMLVPWLILTAAGLFSLQPWIARRTGIGHEQAAISRSQQAGVILFQLLVSIYGGYFGAGIGILMLSALAMMGLADIHRMNAVKSVLAVLINGIAVFVFIAKGIVEWKLAIAMALSSIVGGYLGACTARRLNRQLVRGVVIAIGYLLAAYYFYRQFRG